MTAGVLVIVFLLGLVAGGLATAWALALAVVVRQERRDG